MKVLEKYLGDGVYVSFDGYHVNIAVNHHENHVVSLEEGVAKRSEGDRLLFF